MRAVTHRLRYSHTLDVFARERFPREARASLEGCSNFFLPNHAECNCLAKQLWTRTNSSRTTHTCADKIMETFRKFERYATAIAYLPFGPTSDLAPPQSREVAAIPSVCPFRTAQEVRTPKIPSRGIVSAEEKSGFPTRVLALERLLLYGMFRSSSYRSAASLYHNTVNVFPNNPMSEPRASPRIIPRMDLRAATHRLRCITHSNFALANNSRTKRARGLQYYFCTEPCGVQ